MENILKTGGYTCRVSSVLQKNVKENGKQFLFDGRADSAWSSDQGTPQFVVLDFPESVNFSAFAIQFQGGFAGKDCKIYWTDVGSCEVSESFYPEDVNKVQTFTLKEGAVQVKRIRLVFETSTDFFGRIIAYTLEILKKI